MKQRTLWAVCAGIEKIRATYLEKEDGKKLKQKQALPARPSARPSPHRSAP